VSAPVCEAMSEELVAYLDGEQPEPERGRIESHLATCLGCRREIERVTKVKALVRALPGVEPSAGFEERMWRRLRADIPVATRGKRFRPAIWGLPVLAAAAVVALAWYSLLSHLGESEPAVPVGGPAVAVAPREPTRPQSAPVLQAEVERGSEEALAAASRPPRDLPTAPEDLPPELLEHPELFLRYPVVRRMKKLENFEEVRRHLEQEQRGDLGSPLRPVG